MGLSSLRYLYPEGLETFMRQNVCDCIIRIPTASYINCREITRISPLITDTGAQTYSSIWSFLIPNWQLSVQTGEHRAQSTGQTERQMLQSILSACFAEANGSLKIIFWMYSLLEQLIIYLLGIMIFLQLNTPILVYFILFMLSFFRNW